MANLESLQLQVEQLTILVNNLITSSKQPVDLSSASIVDEDAKVIIQNPGQIVQAIGALDFLFILLKAIGMVDINSEGDLSGAFVFGKPTGARAAINGGNLILGWQVLGSVPNPTTNNDFETPRGFGQ